VVDDGLASGYTMLTSIEFLRRLNPERIIAAAPTAHERTVKKIVGQVDEFHCPNIRGGYSFAVAEAYKEWYDLSDGEVLDILKEFCST
jgi:predicted phosphoribosyltransferase